MSSLMSRSNSAVSTHEPDPSWNLYLEFCGEELNLTRGDSLTFGRTGDLVIDDNPYMHRVVGRFRNAEGVWWLENRSKRQMIELRDLTGPSTLTLAPRRSAAVVFGEFICRFSAGPTTYELNGALESFEWEQDLLGDQGLDSTETMDWGRVEINDDQRHLLLVLCEQYLLEPQLIDAPVISNRQAAVRLGWSITKFNRKLDHLCEKLQRAGVPGLHGDLGGNAVDRRRRLVDHALTAPLVTIDDLVVATEDDPAASAAG